MGLSPIGEARDGLKHPNVSSLRGREDARDIGVQAGAELDYQQSLECLCRPAQDLSREAVAAASVSGALPVFGSVILGRQLVGVE